MNILELDGGVGSIAQLMMETLTSKCPDGRIIPRFARFDVARKDVNRISAIQTRLGDCSVRVFFKELDIGGNIDSEALESTSYDLIVVCLVSIRNLHICRYLSSI
jgi:hypothetical protein